MYYVNEEQIEQRLQFISSVVEACEQLPSAWSADQLLVRFAQERALHLAIETVTDIGSLMIDGFIMRDASSYEDIIDILRQEQVFGAETGATLTELVKLRRPLVQDYISFDRNVLHPLVAELPAVLRKFSEDVRAFIKKELA
ncbi:DUF86 domain-containing protein [Paenibacillus sp. MBLB4367]|uniref:DUF86 domain-containing protein n=1 Tax=Paenibacillus sp. MBLB4367 TaxID=3384767 RepID=UPI0039080844